VGSAVGLEQDQQKFGGTEKRKEDSTGLGEVWVRWDSWRVRMFLNFKRWAAAGGATRWVAGLF
jgi:hypothetical protein